MASSSELVPKSELSAYARWELAPLAETEPTLLGPDSVVERNQSDGLAAAAAADQAQKDGYASGYATGMAEAEESRRRLEALLASIAEDAGGHRQQLLDEVLDFALRLARTMVGETLAVRRELVLPVVSAALKELPQAGRDVQVLLNPVDLELVRTFLAAESGQGGCRLLPDSTIVPGGCRVQAEQCEVDATVQTRWRRLLANLGCSDEWLEPA